MLERREATQLRLSVKRKNPTEVFEGSLGCVCPEPVLANHRFPSRKLAEKRGHVSHLLIAAMAVASALDNCSLLLIGADPGGGRRSSAQP
jgi:hypothetical protein